MCSVDIPGRIYDTIGMIWQPARISRISWATLLCVALLKVCVSPAPAGQRLNGGFFQYNPTLASWPAEKWVLVLDKMREAGLNTVIIQMTAQELSSGQTRWYIPPLGEPDATETILAYSDTNDFQVYIGLYSSQWIGSMTESNFLARLIRENHAAIDRASQRYLGAGIRPSFAGWYLPYEPWTAEYTPAEVARLREFFSQVQQRCQSVSGNGVLAISPFVSAQRPSPCRVEQLYSDLLSDSGVSILMLQDSVGAQGWSNDIPQRVRPYAQAFQRACATNSVRFWANLESFRIADFSPCDPERLKRQFDAMGALPEKFVTFDFVHYMNPVVFLNSWSEERRARMKALYHGYVTDFVTRDYPAVIAPLIHTGSVNGQLILRWPGSPREEFRLETTSNLLQAVWTTVSSGMQYTQGTFSVSVSTDQASPEFFRVRSSARFDLPESMVYVPSGEFLMGKRAHDTNAAAAELPAFTARITRGFWIANHEVTQSEYLNVMCANPSAARGDLDLPVESMSWSDAVLYCERLTQAERVAGRLPSSHQYRLPTEAEWELAARAGSLGIFSFGDDRALLPNYAWTSQNSSGQLHRGRTLSPNEWGLFDCQGNVFEWCLDWLGADPIAGPIDDPIGSGESGYRAARGGSFSMMWSFSRLSSRMMFAPSRRASNLGFRVVVAEVP